MDSEFKKLIDEDLKNYENAAFATLPIIVEMEKTNKKQLLDYFEKLSGLNILNFYAFSDKYKNYSSYRTTAEYSQSKKQKGETKELEKEKHLFVDNFNFFGVENLTFNKEKLFNNSNRWLQEKDAENVQYIINWANDFNMRMAEELNKSLKKKITTKNIVEYYTDILKNQSYGTLINERIEQVKKITSASTSIFVYDGEVNKFSSSFSFTRHQSYVERSDASFFYEYVKNARDIDACEWLVAFMYDNEIKAAMLRDLDISYKKKELSGKELENKSVETISSLISMYNKQASADKRKAGFNFVIYDYQMNFLDPSEIVRDNEVILNEIREVINNTYFECVDKKISVNALEAAKLYLNETKKELEKLEEYDFKTLSQKEKKKMIAHIARNYFGIHTMQKQAMKEQTEEHILFNDFLQKTFPTYAKKFQLEAKKVELVYSGKVEKWIVDLEFDLKDFKEKLGYTKKDINNYVICVNEYQVFSQRTSKEKYSRIKIKPKAGNIVLEIEGNKLEVMKNYGEFTEYLAANIFKAMCKGLNIIKEKENEDKENGNLIDLRYHRDLAYRLYYNKNEEAKIFSLDMEVDKLIAWAREDRMDEALKSVEKEQKNLMKKKI